MKENSNGIVLISVTQDDIDKGERNTTNCMVARAVKRHFGTERVACGFRTVNVDENVFNIFGNETRRFIQNFDAGRAVKPFEFSMKNFKNES